MATRTCAPPPPFLLTSQRADTPPARSAYEQLGLKFKLYSAEVLFNKGLSEIYLGDAPRGLADMEAARAAKATEEHNVIDDAIREGGEGYTVFSIVRPFWSMTWCGTC